MPGGAGDPGPAAAVARVDGVMPRCHGAVVRTTLTIDDDVPAVARALAEQRRTSLGSALSELARRGFRGAGAPRDPDDGSIFRVAPDAGPITSEDVDRALGERP